MIGVTPSRSLNLDNEVDLNQQKFINKNWNNKSIKSTKQNTVALVDAKMPVNNIRNLPLGN
jgi:hypothetical protein